MTCEHWYECDFVPAPELDSLALPSGWKKTLPEVDHQWISETFFHAGKRGPEFDFSRVSKLWYDPPQPSMSRAVLNKPDRYFGHRLFLWMPRHLFHTQFYCPHSCCNGILTNAGVHLKTRRVVDVEYVYNIAAEYLSCSNCHKKGMPFNFFKSGIYTLFDLLSMK